MRATRSKLVLLAVVPMIAGCAAILGFDDLTGEASVDGGQGGEADSGGTPRLDAAADVPREFEASTPGSADSCAVTHCCDGKKSGDETGTDCGGSACAPCGVGVACQSPTDCASARCADGVCGCMAGTLSFSSVNLPLPSPRPNGIASGDFDGDGRSDLVTAFYGAASCEFLAAQTGDTFREPKPFPCGNGMITVLDYDKDGHLDVAGSEGIALSDGAGHFATPLPFPDVGSALDQQISFADFNGDGMPDIHAASYSKKGTFVFLQTNGAPGPLAVGLTGGFGAGAGTGDFNGDGKADLIGALEYTSPSAPPGVGVSFGAGNGSFAKQVFQSTLATCDARHVGVHDLNGDGKLDLVVMCGSSKVGVAVLLGRGDGTFNDATHYGAFNGIDINLVDVDRDGFIDIVTSDVVNEIKVFLGKGDGTFASALGFPAGTTPATVTAADFNGDGRVDVAASNVDSQNVTVFFNECQ